MTNQEIGANLESLALKRGVEAFVFAFQKDGNFQVCFRGEITRTLGLHQITGNLIQRAFDDYNPPEDPLLK